MATDDSISEDVSTPVALCADHVENGVRMDRASSLVTTVDAVFEKARRDVESSPSMEGGPTATGMAKNRDPIAPVSNGAHKSRNLHLHVNDSGRRTLTSINPTALETLMSLVQEIQSSGAIDPEIWRDCEVRWLQLFQLVEKQHRDQILSQQEQYQRQVQLIQDEIKALVQLKNLPRSAQNPGSSLTSGAGDSPALPGPLRPHLLTSKSPDSARAGCSRSKAQESREEGVTTVSSSGYATLSTLWGEGGGPSFPYGLTPDSELLNPESQQELTNRVSPGAPPANCSPSAAQPKAPSVLTSWAQKRGKPGSRSGRSRRCRAGEEEEEEEGGSSLSADGERRDEDYRAASLKRSDSLISEASGLTYWRLDEDELYRPLPDSFDSGAYLLLQDLSLNQISQDGPTLPMSLREIYQRKQQEGRDKRDGWDSSFTSNASTPQVLTLDPTLHMKHSDRTSGFTSPSHFSSPSSPHQPPLGGGVSAVPVLSLDSISEGPSVRDLSDPNGSSPGLSPASKPVEEGPNNEGGPQTVRHPFTSPVQSGSNLERTAASPSSVEDPLIQSLVRQSLKEKHSRHVADLRAYYESEISSLKQQLASRYEDPGGGLARSSQDLLERCEHLDRALTEASARIRDLEKENSHLESQLAGWPERYAAADAAVQALRARLEDADLGGREKEAVLSRLQSRVRELQEALDTASRVSQGQNAEMWKGRDMLQELLAELDSLRKDHERVKDNLVSAENRLFDANSQIAELKRFGSKLESQVKQLEHENLLKTRQMIQARSPGLCQRPDLLLSPSKGRPHLNGDQKRPSPEPDLSAHSGPASDRTAAHVSRYYTPSEETPTPMIKALSRLEEARGSNAFTPHRAGVGRGRTAAGFVEGGGSGPAHPKAEGSLSPEGNRSSSHPPCCRKGTLISTPTKRETLITPVSAEWSPKRCPTENYSTAFGDSPVQRLYRFDGSSDLMDPSSCSLSHSSSLRKRLQFTNEGVEAVHCQPTNGVPGSCNGAEPAEEEQEELAVGLSDSHQAQVQSLADTEQLFDDLTQEKQQIEAELSRIPAAGARVTLRTRLDEVALEKRLEKVNHDLGAIRMTLKRFHVLRSSANV